LFCQDNEISWYDWEHADEALLAFTRWMIEFRKEHRVFRRRTFFQGRPIHGSGVGDIAWFTPSGDEMEEHDWAEGFANSLAVFLNGDALETGRRGEEYTDDSFLLLFNAHHEAVTFTLPGAVWGETWDQVAETAHGGTDGGSTVAKAGDIIGVEARSMLVLRRAPTT
jgi:glycogen operon protein